MVAILTSGCDVESKVYLGAWEIYHIAGSFLIYDNAKIAKNHVTTND